MKEVCMKIRNLPKKIAIFLIVFYQKHISIGLKPNCKYYPTCSEYSKEAYSKYGFMKGTFLTLKRILKCNPFSKGGVDLLK